MKFFCYCYFTQNCKIRTFSAHENPLLNTTFHITTALEPVISPTL